MLCVSGPVKSGRCRYDEPTYAALPLSSENVFDNQIYYERKNHEIHSCTGPGDNVLKGSDL